MFTIDVYKSLARQSIGLTQSFSHWSISFLSSSPFRSCHPRAFFFILPFRCLSAFSMRACNFVCTGRTAYYIGHRGQEFCCQTYVAYDLAFVLCTAMS